MADVKISQLLLMDSPASLPITNAISDSDELIVNDFSSLITKRVKLEDVLLLRNRNIDDTSTGSEVTGDLNVTGNLTFGGNLEDQFGNTVTDLSTLITQEYLESLIGVGTTLNCLRDSAPTRSGSGCGVTVTGELTVDSDLWVLGTLYGDGTGLTDIQYALKADSADHTRYALTANVANTALYAIRADSAYHSRLSDVSKKIQTVQVNTDAVFYPTFVGVTPGVDSVSTDANFTYNPNDNILSAGFFSGDGSLLTNVNASGSTALVTANLGVNNADYFVSFRPTLTGADSTNTDDNLRYNPVTNVLRGGTNATDLFLFGGSQYSKQTDAKEAVGVSNYVMVRSLATGVDSVSTSTGLTFDASTETLSATFLSGDGTGVTNVDAVTATTATNVTITNVTDNATYFVHMGSSLSGGDGVNASSALRYNPSTNRLAIASDTNAMTLGADSDLAIYHDGSNAYIDTKTGGLNITSSTGTTVVVMNNLPTVDPVNAGQLWNDLGTLKISSGT